MCLFYISWKLHYARLGGGNFKIQMAPEGLVKSLYFSIGLIFLGLNKGSNSDHLMLLFTFATGIIIYTMHNYY